MLREPGKSLLPRAAAANARVPLFGDKSIILVKLDSQIWRKAFEPRDACLRGRGEEKFGPEGEWCTVLNVKTKQIGIPKKRKLGQTLLGPFPRSLDTVVYGGM